MSSPSSGRWLWHIRFGTQGLTSPGASKAGMAQWEMSFQAARDGKLLLICDPKSQLSAFCSLARPYTIHFWILTEGHKAPGKGCSELLLPGATCPHKAVQEALYKGSQKEEIWASFFSWCDWMGTAVLGTWGLLQFVHIFEGTGSPPAFKGSREPSGAVQDLGTSHILGNYMFLSTDIELPMLSNSGSIPCHYQRGWGFP